MRLLARIFAIALVVFITNCGRSSILAQESLAEETQNANLDEDKDEILDSFPDPAPSPSSTPGSGLSGKLGKLSQLFKQSQGSSGGALKSKLLGAFCQLKSMKGQMQPSQGYPSQRGFKKFGGLLAKFQQKIGSMMKMGGGGSSQGGVTGPVYSQANPQVMQKLSSICQGGTSGATELEGMSLAYPSYQQNMAIDDLDSATNYMNGALF